MNFSSMVFIFLFLALNILIHNLCRDMKAKNITMLVFSLVFYAWAGLRFIVILLGDVLICWIFALLIAGTEDERLRKRFLTACVFLVLLVLGIFKYSSFFLLGIQRVTGIPKMIPTILLPVGISFYSFQLISYVVDVYRGEVRPQKRYWILLLYASLFHQCVAGPIVRYSDIQRDIRCRRTNYKQTSRGISRFTIGLAKKAILANSCAVIADTYFAHDVAGLAAQSAAGLWLGGLAFLFQIYFDFSGYSDMAIGMGLMCGFHYLENFNYPYIADSVKDFWRRWHISLSRFFRDYVYIPLGGNRSGKARQLLNLLIVWTLTGFWHGASWNYVLWGLYFFAFLTAERFLFDKISLPKALRHVLVLLIVYFCWILFKFEDPVALGTVLRGLFCGNGNPASSLAVMLDLRANYLLLLFCAVAATPFGHRLHGFLQAGAAQNKTAFAVYSVWETLYPVALLLISAMALTGNSYNPFLYYIF